MSGAGEGRISRRLGIFSSEPATTRQALVAERDPAKKAMGRPPNPVPTYPVTVMLTNEQTRSVDDHILRFNYTARQAAQVDGRTFLKVKRNHFFQAFIEAVEEAGYDLSPFHSLDDLKADLLRRLKQP